MRTLYICVSLLAASAAAQPARWTEAAANAWYAQQPWLVGGNYTPANAINQLELWQAESFDAARIDKELGWAARDSVWDPFPQTGRQRAPKPGVHNSGWVQGPGAKALTDPAQWPRLEAYVKGVAADLLPRLHRAG